jgi:hypothetical protein
MVFIYYLILGVIYLTVAFFTIRWLMRIPKKGKHKALVAVTGIVVFLLIPTWDEILGRIYLRHLCATKAGVKVYKTVELPAEYWDENEQPIFMNSRGVLDMEILGDRLEWRRQKTLCVKHLIKIEKDQWILYDKQLQRKLAEKISFTRYFGWINKFSPAPNVAESCRDLCAREYSQSEFALKEALKERAFILEVITQSINQ